MTTRYYCICYTARCHRSTPGKALSETVAARHILADLAALDSKRAELGQPDWYPPPESTAQHRAYQIKNVQQLGRVPSTSSPVQPMRKRLLSNPDSFPIAKQPRQTNQFESDPANVEDFMKHLQELREKQERDENVGITQSSPNSQTFSFQGHPHDDYGEELASSRDRSMSPCELRKINREKDEDEIMSDGAGGDEEAEEDLDLPLDQLANRHLRLDEEDSPSQHLGHRNQEPTEPDDDEEDSPESDDGEPVGMAPDKNSTANTSERPPYLSRLSHTPGYETPTLENCPTEPPSSIPLDKLEMHSLRHYYLAKKNGDTQRSFDLNRKEKGLLAGFDELLLSRAKCEKLLERLSGLKAEGIDCCRHGCQAFTGEFKDDDYCRSPRLQEKRDQDGVVIEKDGKPVKFTAICGESRWKLTKEGIPKLVRGKRVVAHQAVFLDFIPRFRALLSNSDFACSLRYFHNHLKSSVNSRLNPTTGTLDFSNPEGVIHDVPDAAFAASRSGFFLTGDHTSAIALNVDGARVERNRPGELWPWTLTIYDVSPTQGRYRRIFHLDVLLSYGPSNPSNLESFNYIIFQRVMDASVGFWIWRSIGGRTGWIQWRAGLIAMLADLMASRKCSGLMLVNGTVGCGVCDQVSTAPSVGGGRYYPRAGASKYGRDGLGRQINKNLPLAGYTPGLGTPAALHDQKTYLKRLEEIFGDKTTPSQAAELKKKYGISFPPLAAELPLFDIAVFWGYDVAHGLCNNFGLKMIKIWIELGFKDVVNKAGAKMAASSVNFPSLFGVMPRDIARYCNTQYRLFELAIWIRFFSIPCLRDAGLPKEHLDHWATFVHLFCIVTGTKTVKVADRIKVEELAELFNFEHERLYVQYKPELVARFPLSIHRMIHIGPIMHHLGNPSHYQQLYLERRIGVLKRYATSKPFPFRSIINGATISAQFDIVFVAHPELASIFAGFDAFGEAAQPTCLQLTDKLNQNEFTQDLIQYHRHQEALRNFIKSLSLDPPLPTDDVSIKRLPHFGKAYLKSSTLASSLSNESTSKRDNLRSASWILSTTVNSDGEKAVGAITLGKVVAYFRLSREKRVGSEAQSGGGVDLSQKPFAVVELYPPGSSLYPDGTAPYFPSSPTQCKVIALEDIDEVVAVYESMDSKLFIMRQTEVGFWGFVDEDSMEGMEDMERL